MNLKERAQKLKTDIPAVFIAMKKKDTPIGVKIIAGLTVAYALSPIDLIPDFIPVLGYIDDIILLPALVALTIRMIPTDVFDACHEESKGIWSAGKPKKWYYALPIVLIWILILFLIIRAIFKMIQ